MLKALVEKTKTIRKQLGSLAPVLERRLEERLAPGFSRRDADGLARAIEDERLDAGAREGASPGGARGRPRTREQELKRADRRAANRCSASRANGCASRRRDLRQTISCGLELLGAEPPLRARRRQPGELRPARPRGRARSATRPGAHARHAARAAASAASRSGNGGASSADPAGRLRGPGLARRAGGAPAPRAPRSSSACSAASARRASSTTTCRGPASA